MHPSSPLGRALARLDGLVDWERRARFGRGGPRMRQSVEPARDLLDRLGAPDRTLSSVLVAGSKAKGSVASLVSAGLRAGGLAEGLYTSPHVERIHERIRLGGRPIDDGALAEVLGRTLDVLDRARGTDAPAAAATWFDVLTAAGLLAMERAGCRWAVLECGLGGRLDSTNAVEPRLAVLTRVELEHTAILGATRALIAREKAGIARPGVPLVSAAGPPGDEAADEVARVARDVGAELVPVRLEPADPIAVRNLALAGAVLDALGRLPGGPAAGAGLLTPEALAEAALPGRLEVRPGDPPVVLDGAHVPASLEEVLRDLEALTHLRGPLHAVFGCGVEKDASGLLKVLRGRVDRLLCTSPGPGPYRPARVLARLARDLGLAAEPVADAELALDRALEGARGRGWVLVTGSLHLVGRLRARTTLAARSTP